VRCMTLISSAEHMLPGAVLLEEFMVPRDVSMNMLAQAIRVPTNRISEIIRGRRAITADSVIRLAKFFGNSEEFWLGLQSSYDLELARKQVSDDYAIAAASLEATFPDVEDDEADALEFKMTRVGHLRFHDSQGNRAGVTFFRESGYHVLYWMPWDDFDGPLVVLELKLNRLPNTASELRWHIRQFFLKGYEIFSLTPNFAFLVGAAEA
jgi:addiction module HigA family antidote